MKILAVLLGAVVLSSAGALVYGIVGPWYDPSPLDAPVAFPTEQPEASTFSVGRSGDYLVEIEFRRDLLSSEETDALLDAANPVDNSSEPDLHWSILQHGATVAEGPSGEYRYSSFRGDDSIGLTVGRVPLEAGDDYKLKVDLGSGWPIPGHASPRVLIRLHPADLEYLTVLKLVGGAGFVAAGTVLTLLGGIAMIRRWTRQSALER